MQPAPPAFTRMPKSRGLLDAAGLICAALAAALARPPIASALSACALRQSLLSFKPPCRAPSGPLPRAGTASLACRPHPGRAPPGRTRPLSRAGTAARASLKPGRPPPSQGHTNGQTPIEPPVPPPCSPGGPEERVVRANAHGASRKHTRGRQTSNSSPTGVATILDLSRAAPAPALPARVQSQSGAHGSLIPMPTPCPAACRWPRAAYSGRTAWLGGLRRSLPFTVRTPAS